MLSTRSGQIWSLFVSPTIPHAALHTHSLHSSRKDYLSLPETHLYFSHLKYFTHVPSIFYSLFNFLLRFLMSTLYSHIPLYSYIPCIFSLIHITISIIYLCVYIYLISVPSTECKLHEGIIMHVLFTTLLPAPSKMLDPENIQSPIILPKSQWQ